MNYIMNNEKQYLIDANNDYSRIVEELCNTIIVVVMSPDCHHIDIYLNVKATWHALLWYLSWSDSAIRWMTFYHTPSNLRKEFHTFFSSNM